MALRNRRELLSDTSKGMLLAGLGLSISQDLGLAPLWAAEEPARLTFGAREPLVEFLAQTPPEKIIQACIAKIRAGTSVRDLVAAAALTNARAFGGEDYVGFHTLMALSPAWSMTNEEGNSPQAALPVLKVLYRNANRLKERGTGPDTLSPLPAVAISAERGEKSALRDAVRAKNLNQSEQAFAPYASLAPGYGIDALMEMVDDGADVHRIVLVPDDPPRRPDQNLGIPTDAALIAFGHGQFPPKTIQPQITPVVSRDVDTGGWRLKM